MKRWRSLNQIEMDLRWKKLAERTQEEVLDKYKVEETPWNGEEYAETKDLKLGSGE